MFCLPTYPIQRSCVTGFQIFILLGLVNNTWNIVFLTCTYEGRSRSLDPDVITLLQIKPELQYLCQSKIQMFLVLQHICIELLYKFTKIWESYGYHCNCPWCSLPQDTLIQQRFYCLCKQTAVIDAVHPRL